MVADHQGGRHQAGVVRSDLVSDHQGRRHRAAVRTGTMKKALAAIVIAALFGACNASAQTYPSKPITVENVTGAGGSIGVTRLVRAPADGYTIEMGTSTTNMLLGGLYPLPFDLINDIAPILMIASEPLMIVGKKALPAKDLKELIAWLKANPDKASIGIPAVGGTGHLAGLSFLNDIGNKAQLVP